MLLNSEIRGQIQVLSDQGLKQVEIAKKLNINQSKVSRNLKKRCKPNLEANENKTNRKRKVNEKVTSALFKIIKKTPKKSIRKMAQEINQVKKISISHMTVKRILNDNNFKAYSPLKKPLLSKKNIRLRKERCEEFLFLSDDEIKSIIWSDESKFNLFTSDGKIKVWREPGTGLDIKHVHSTVKYGGGSVMVWACFSYQGVGKLVFIDGIMDSKKYVNILSNNLKASADVMELENFIFQQDNDPKHTSKLAKKFFEYKNIKLLPWPPQSPDLNPIETMWAIIKPKVEKMGPRTIEELKNCIIKAWESIDKSTCEELALSLKIGLQLVMRPMVSIRNINLNKTVLFKRIDNCLYQH